VKELERELKEVEGKIKKTGKATIRPELIRLRAGADLTHRMAPQAIYPPDHPCWQIILDGMAVGGSLSSVLARDSGMPSLPLVRKRIASDLDFQARYEKALQDRADKLAEEIIEISDSTPPEGLEPAAMSAWVADKRLRVDARKWVAAKLQPKRYGDRIDVAVTDTRISVMDALAQAKQRVLNDNSDVVDVESRDV
jgi:hypothetical protein